MKFTISNINELTTVADEIIKLSNTKKIILFYGKMGAGKTTLIKEICKRLNTVDNITSPTFSIINEYETQNKQIIYHFDFYRIESADELLNIGIEEYFDSGNICLIEWPQIIEHFFDKSEIIKIEISVENNNRIFSVK